MTGAYDPGALNPVSAARAEIKDSVTFIESGARTSPRSSKHKHQPRDGDLPVELSERPSGDPARADSDCDSGQARIRASALNAYASRRLVAKGIKAATLHGRLAPCEGPEG